MDNMAFRRAVASLAHPISMTAIVVVLLNDHVWRRAVPSWFTGKIGDFAWLVFAPFLLAALLAWLVPPRLSRYSRALGSLAIVATGVLFSVVKTVPAVHALVIESLEAVIGGPQALRLDPTDLLALPALLISWLVWNQAHPVPIHRLAGGRILLALAAMTTIANTAAPNFGLRCLAALSNWTIVTYDAYEQFASSDGGLTWHTVPNTSPNWDCQPPNAVLPDPSDPLVQYRFTPNEAIERSEDGGQTWQMEFRLASPSDPELALHQLGKFWAWDRPSDAIIHQPTGNPVLTMGYDGVLVRTAGGQWLWVSVGDYAHADLKQFSTLIKLLSGEGMFGLLLLLLMPAAIVRGASRARRRGLFMLWLALAWLAWFGGLLIFPPAISTGYAHAMVGPTALAVALLAMPVGLESVIAAIRHYRAAVVRLLVVSLASVLLFLLPYVLWSQGAFPFYTTAALFAWVLVGATLLAGDHYVRPAIEASAVLSRRG